MKSKFKSTNAGAGGGGDVAGSVDCAGLDLPATTTTNRQQLHQRKQNLFVFEFWKSLESIGWPIYQRMYTV